MPIECMLYCNNNSGHLNQVYTGFGLLKKRDICKVDVVKGDRYQTVISGDPVLSVVVKIGSNKAKICYDMRDGAAISTKLIENSDFYFKRSYDNSIHKNSKILPFGFNYLAYGDVLEDFSITKLLFDAKHIRTIKNLEHFLINVCRSSRSISRIFNINSGRYNCHFTEFESFPNLSESNSIILFTRTWDPSLAKNSDLSDERNYINQMRADCIRILRKEFGPDFKGGFYRDKYSIEKYPDCVVADRSAINRRNYIKNVKNATICISSMGLEKSNGWRIAEYIALSKAIVSEKLYYEVPGNFNNNTNYLEFTDAESCLGGVYSLYHDYEKRVKMMKNNFIYYNQHMRPDVIVMNSLLIAFGEL